MRISTPGSTYNITNWSTIRSDDDPYLPPECNGLALYGLCPEFADEDNPEGNFIRTSPIVKIEGRKITTKSGSIYILGKEDPEWLAWMQANYIAYDPQNPIRDLRKKT